MSFNQFQKQIDKVRTGTVRHGSANVSVLISHGIAAQY